ncbi:VOC family protein [Glaciibacter psychrotolerans]|uniref:VOC family protein n=1 Tax=Glaciibacter psychrotolerans TaxID=670054 RepID=A0A7Z0EF05_9MICO|nr:hypothetical protein [Leifsonia psychrotolerans]NYJ20448.1 hypothetical protein [Leifsonia psychrotolerans]
MPLLGITVHNFDAEVERYTALFGVTFHVFRAGIDYELRYAADPGTDTSPPLSDGLRIAVDTSDRFELVELPGAPEGFRNVHFRVDDIDAATAHFRQLGLVLAQEIWAGTAREVVFDASSLNGIRLCLLQFEGESFAEALAASPRS